MSFVATFRREHLRQCQQSHGQVPGYYLRPEKLSAVQFPPIFLGFFNHKAGACQQLDKQLSTLYERFGGDNVRWYIERSLGLDCAGRIAWCNMDLSEEFLDYICEA